ncbi:MAG: hypothetical protein CMJ31_11400 [Phycisphaerae bacterium]|nr:hypothetical protein [Phycisphaerae bacterium]
MRRFIAMLSFVPLALCVGCEEPAVAVDPASDDAFGEADQAYTVRGRLVQLPTSGGASRSLKIHHEHIPAFVGSDGEVHRNANGVLGMLSMQMAFPLVDPDVDLSTYEVGDKVRFTFEVRWREDGAAEWRVTAMEPLDADVELDFGAPAPAVTPEP